MARLIAHSSRPPPSFVTNSLMPHAGDHSIDIGRFRRSDVRCLSSPARLAEGPCLYKLPPLSYNFHLLPSSTLRPSKLESLKLIRSARLA